MVAKPSVHRSLSQDQAGACARRALLHPAQVCGAHAAGFRGCFLLVPCQPHWTYEYQRLRMKEKCFLVKEGTTYQIKASSQLQKTAKEIT